jgi:hypothetical protein
LPTKALPLFDFGGGLQRQHLERGDGETRNFILWGLLGSSRARSIQDDNCCSQGCRSYNQDLLFHGSLLIGLDIFRPKILVILAGATFARLSPKARNRTHGAIKLTNSAAPRAAAKIETVIFRIGRLLLASTPRMAPPLELQTVVPEVSHALGEG